MPFFPLDGRHIHSGNYTVSTHIFIQIHIKIEGTATALRRNTCQPTAQHFWAYYYTTVCTQWESEGLFSLNRERRPSPGIRERRGRVSLETSQEAQREVLVFVGRADVEELATATDSNQLWSRTVNTLGQLQKKRHLQHINLDWVPHSETICYNLTALDLNYFAI